MLAAVMLTLTGCTEDYYGAYVFSHEYTIIPGNWTRNSGIDNPGTDNYLYAEFENKDITPDVLDNGTVTADVYAIYNVQQDLGSWHPLPYVYPIAVNVTDQSTGATHTEIVAETIRMEWELGKVTFIIQELDGWDPDDMLSKITVRVNVTKNVLL